MSAFDRFAKGLPAAEPAPYLGKRFVCMAHGCPVVAGIERSESEMVCRFHFHTRSADWQHVTDVLRKHLWIVRLADTCDTPEIFAISDWAARATQFAERNGMPDLAPNPKREIRDGVIRSEIAFPRLYAQRLSSALVRLCNVNRKAPEIVRGKPANGGAKLSDLLPPAAKGVDDDDPETRARV